VRDLADADRIRRFMRALGAAAREDGDVYFTGGATAVLLGWRKGTLRTQEHVAHQCRPRLAARLRPGPGGWEERSLFADREGRLTFRHFDPYGQARELLARHA
jgi:hypothetical protein